MILVTILVAIHVTDNDVLVSELLFPLAAFLIVKLNLEVLITIKINVIVDSVSPESIISISFFDLVRPPRDLLLNLIMTTHQFIEILVHEMLHLSFHKVFLHNFPFLLLLSSFDLDLFLIHCDLI